MGTMAAALARLLGAQGQEIEDRVAHMHGAVADRVFGALGPLGTPSRVVHDAVSSSVHGTLRAALGGVGRVGGLLAAQVPDDVVLESRRARTLAGVVLGLIGDHVRDEEPELAWSMTLLAHDDERVVVSAGTTVEPTTADVLVVLVHGLCETELAWSVGSGPRRPPLPEVLAGPDREVLLARMNSGLRPAELGADLADLLEQRTGSARVVLIGHSLGGLVARAALRTATTRGQGWVAGCDTLVTLGTPHLGAPLEKAVDVLVRAGGLAPEIDALTRWFEQRSAGIRDLRHGVDDDAAKPGIAVVAAPLPPHVRLHTIGAALPGRVGAVVGDGLVRPVSAHARGVRRPVRARRGESLDVVGSHFDLLCHPTVTAHVARLLAAEASPALERT